MVEIQENQEVEEEEVKNCWSDLPEELLVLIKSRLFVGDYTAFVGVCRSWRSTYSLIRSLPPPIDCPFRSSPCMMFIQRENHMSMFFHPIYNASYAIDIPELYNSYILASNYGWLLLSTGGPFQAFFFNPFTREKIKLPEMFLGYTSMHFTSPPTSDDCLVIGFYIFDTRVEVGILRRGQEYWENHSFEDNEEFWSSSCTPVLFNGLYYVLGNVGNIGVFDLKNLSWNVFVKPFELEANSIRRSFLAELDGRLVAACISRDGDNEVSFFSLDLTNMVWQTEQSIGDETLYASCGSTFVKKAVVNGMSNVIYLPFYSAKNGVFYSLKTKKFHSFEGGDSFTEKKILREKCNAWIEPNFESVGYEKLTW